MLTEGCINITKIMSDSKKMVKLNRFKIDIPIWGLNFKKTVAKIINILEWDIIDIKRIDETIEIYVEIPTTIEADTIEVLVENLV